LLHIFGKLADLFLYSHESEFLQKLVKAKKIHEAKAFNFTYRYIDDVLSINNSRFAELPSGIIFNSINNYLEIMFPIDVLRFSEFRAMKNHLSEIIMLNDIQISYYFECLIKELGINSNTSSNTTYKPTSFDKDEILANHRSFMTSLNIFNLSCGRVVYRVEKSKVLMEDT
jgi:hypothetical protein